MKTGLLAFLLLIGVTVTARYATAPTKPLHDAVAAGARSSNVVAGRGVLEDYHYAIQYMDWNVCDRNKLRNGSDTAHVEK